MKTSRTPARRRLAASGFPLLLLLLLGIQQEGLCPPDPNRNYRMRSLFWKPYSGDQDTLGLFHLDAQKALTDKDLEKEMHATEKVVDAAADIDPLAAHERGEGSGNVEDSGPQKLNAELLGPTQWSATGRFDGSLRLQKASSALVTRAYPDLKGGRDGTVECWIQATRPAIGYAVLMSLDSQRPKMSSLELRYTSEGKLVLAARGAELQDNKELSLGEDWVHLAMEWTRQPVQKVSLLLQGMPAHSWEHPALSAALRDLSGVVRLGNHAGGSAGLACALDEVRVSCMARPYYRWEVVWTDEEAKRPVVDSEPYLRDRRDLLFGVGFDNTLDPLTASEGTAWDIPLPASAQGDPRQESPKPEYLEGVRGKALAIGSALAVPTWTGQGNFNPVRGSFELWLQPLDWDNHKVQSFHDPMEHVPFFRVVNTAQKQHGLPADVLSFGIFRKQPREMPPHPPIEPGRWYHIVGAYDRGNVRLYLNGKPMPEATAYCTAARPPAADAPAANYLILLDPIQPRVNYNAERTLVDELRLYSRPLTPEEVANSFERYRPDPQLKPLPFAHVQVAMNYPLRIFHAALELLGPRRDEVASAHLRAFGPEDGAAPIAEGRIPEFPGGRGELRLAPARISYGKHRTELKFLDKAGVPVEEMTMEQERERPPWLGSNVGFHNEVLPGWIPMKAEGNSVQFWGRELVLGGGGWPEKIFSQGQDLLAEPIRILAASAGGQPIAWKAPSGLPAISQATDVAVVTEGTLEGGGWRLSTRITTEYDGLMKIEATLSAMESGAGSPPAELDFFRIEIPLKASHALLLGYWTGEPNFRAGTWHDLLPAGEGVVFASNKPWCARHPEIRGSFIPHLFLGDDERGLAWFAENDRGWSQSAETPAIEIVRQGKIVALRLNIIHEKTLIKEPRTIVFGLHPTPVKPLPPDWRSWGSKLNFGFCDSFSMQQLKSAGDYGNFNIYPENYDWDSAKRRSDKHRELYASYYGYRGPFLYMDRNWVGAPPSAGEFAGIWYRSGFFRYLPEARDCHLWNIDQWIKRQLIVGVYVDDVWVGSCKDPETGPAYTLEDGKVQPGFEFFDYHEYMKRLRWIFIDNGLPPAIWCHMTHTLFIPCLSFSEYLLDGEDRFPAWGVDWDFMDAWSHGRIRYNSAQKWGLVPTWFIKIGGDSPAPTPMPHWQYRQSRAYTAATVVHDIVAMGVPAEILQEIYAQEARCVGYWSPDNPAHLGKPELYATFWLRAGKTVGMIVNRSKETLETTVAIDPEKLGFPGVKADAVSVADIDLSDPPKGEDMTKIKTPQVPSASEGEEADEFMDELSEEERQEKIKASGIVPLDDHNFRWKEGNLTLRLRGHDYRLLLFTSKEEFKK